MRPPDRARGARISEKLRRFSTEVRDLPGIRQVNNRECLVEQIIESIRRVEYVYAIRDRPHDARRMDPSSDLFDPLKGAILHYRRGHVDEAFWLVFLAIHFGKHAKDGWRLARDIYGRLGEPGVWTWAAIIKDPGEFRTWLTTNQARLQGDGITRRFSNHRKYESLDALSDKGTAAVLESYVQWVGPPRTHQQQIRDVHQIVGQHPQEVFDYLFRSMDSVSRFGRLAKFDYLTMLGKLGIAPIDPGSAYLSGATGPLEGARLLFGDENGKKLSWKALDGHLVRLGGELELGMQILEDSLCNWQKSPAKFISFRG